MSKLLSSSAWIASALRSPRKRDVSQTSLISDSVSGVSYEVGSGQMLDGMDDVLPGMSAGETTTYTTPLAGGDRAGEEALVRLTVQSVKERNPPEADDDFAQLASEFDTLDELKADLRERVERVKQVEQAGQIRDKVLEALLEAVEVPLPDGARIGLADTVFLQFDVAGRG